MSKKTKHKSYTLNILRQTPGLKDVEIKGVSYLDIKKFYVVAQGVIRYRLKELHKNYDKLYKNAK